MIQDQQILLDKYGKNGWLRVFVTGLLLFFAGIVILILTRNPNLFPTVVMIGNFLIPVTFVIYFYERRHWSRLSLPTTALSFFYGGVLGVLASSILEPIFIRQLNLSNVFVVGFIEEFAKILGVLVIARRWQHDAEMDGLILGAAAGMGFAALESNGYAFSAFLFSGGSLTLTVAVTLIRGVLSPLGHGVWTAILASVLFRESDGNRFRINRKVLAAFLTVVILHGLWDGLPGLIAFLLGPGFDVFIGQSLVAGIGLFILWRRWREAMRLQTEQQRSLFDAEIPIEIPYSFFLPEKKVES
jgi:RsiW-degrading membrane proteinase PrsW (M82 family)